MAKIKPLAIIESMSGKVCMHSDMYFRTNKQTSKTFTGKLCNPYKGEPDPDVVAARSRFRKVQAAVRTRLAVPATLATITAEFKAQTEIGSVFGYAFHKWNSEYDQNGDHIGD